MDNGGTLGVSGKPLPLCPAGLEGYEKAGMTTKGKQEVRGARMSCEALQHPSCLESWAQGLISSEQWLSGGIPYPEEPQEQKQSKGYGGTFVRFVFWNT